MRLLGEVAKRGCFLTEEVALRLLEVAQCSTEVALRLLCVVERLLSPYFKGVWNSNIIGTEE